MIGAPKISTKGKTECTHPDVTHLDVMECAHTYTASICSRQGGKQDPGRSGEFFFINKNKTQYCFLRTSACNSFISCFSSGVNCKIKGSGKGRCVVYGERKRGGVVFLA